MTAPSSFLLSPSVWYLIYRSYLKGLRSALGSPKLFALFAVQIAIGIGCYLSLAYLSLSYRTELTGYVVGTVDSWWEYALSWLVFLILLALNGVAAYLLTALIGGFVLEWFAQMLLKELGVPVEEELSVNSLARMIKRTALFTVLRASAGTVALLVSLASLFFPPLAIVTFLAVSFLIGVDMLELPTSALEPKTRRELDLLRRHRAIIFLFGLCAAGLLAIPFFGIFFLPVVCGAACHVVRGLYEKIKDEGSVPN